MKCNLIIPGFAKCGTSSMHEYLDQHPEICMSSVKEPHFFAFADRMNQGIAAHDQLFAHAESSAKVFGESSTLYGVWEPALREIASRNEQMRVIVLLREPVDRLISHYRWMYAIGKEKAPLPKALLEEQQSAADPNIHRGYCYPWYRRHSSYHEFGPLIQEIFGKENVLFLKSEQLSEDEVVVLSAAFEFLGLDPIDSIRPINENQTQDIQRHRSFGLSTVAKWLPDSVENFLNQKLNLKARAKRLLGVRHLKAPHAE